MNIIIGELIDLIAKLKLKDKIYPIDKIAQIEVVRQFDHLFHLIRIKTDFTLLGDQDHHKKQSIHLFTITKLMIKLKSTMKM